ncbi:MAG: hypothetical protein AAFQ83_02525 [Bacteroidota bacterium]
MNLLDRIGYRGGNYVIGLQVDLQVKTYVTMELKQENGRITRQREHLFHEEEKLWEYLDHRPGVPLVLVMQTESVSRLFSPSQRGSIQDVLGVKVDKVHDFVSQRLPGVDGSTWMAVTRREPIDALLQWLENYAQRVVYVSFFHAVQTYLVTGLPTYQETTSYLLNETYHWKNGLCTSVSHSPVELTLSEMAYQLHCKEDRLLLFGSLAHFMLSRGVDFEGHEVVASQRDKVLKMLPHIRLATQLIMGLFIILLCMGGFRAFQSWEIERQALTLSQNRSVLDQLSQNHQLIQQQSAFLLSSGQGSFRSSQLARHLDLLGQYAPATMRFRLLIFQPDEAQRKKWARDLAETIDFLLVGEAGSARDITSLSRTLQLEDVYEEVRIHESNFDYQLGAHTFTLIIQVADE